MKGLKINLKVQYFLLLWLPLILAILGAWYYIKKINYPVLTEIRLPQEYIEFLNISSKEAKEAKKREEIRNFTHNPFASKSLETKVEQVSTYKEQRIISLSSILILDKRACIINNKLYKEGDKIDKLKISKIGDYYVVLTLPNNKKVYLEVGATYTY